LGGRPILELRGWTIRVRFRNDVIDAHIEALAIRIFDQEMTVVIT
jgi:hypothetical protein